jgi:hypothetical protein
LPSHTLTIPRRYKAAIAKIHALSNSSYEEFLGAAETVQPFGITRAVESRIAELAPSVKPTDVREILSAVLSLQLARSLGDAPLEQFCADVCEAMREAGSHQLTLSPDECGALSKRLQRLLSLDSLSIAAKGRDLQTEQHQTYVGSRILTDLRAVFRDSPEESPLGMVLFHVLKLTFFERGEGRPRDFYLALDEADLRSLKKVIERAEVKSKTLRSSLQTAGIRCLEDNAE